jgi:hypothetical protein
MQMIIIIICIVNHFTRVYIEKRRMLDIIILKRLNLNTFNGIIEGSANCFVIEFLGKEYASREQTRTSRDNINHPTF